MATNTNPTSNAGMKNSGPATNRTRSTDPEELADQIDAVAILRDHPSTASFVAEPCGVGDAATTWGAVSEPLRAHAPALLVSSAESAIVRIQPCVICTCYTHVSCPRSGTVGFQLACCARFMTSRDHGHSSDRP